MPSTDFAKLNARVIVTPPWFDNPLFPRHDRPQIKVASTAHNYVTKRKAAVWQLCLDPQKNDSDSHRCDANTEFQLTHS